MAFFRWAAAAAVLLPIFGASIWRYRAALRREWRTVALLALAGAIVFNYMIFRGTQTTTAINGALLNASVPIYIVLLSFAGIGERNTAGRIAGIGIALAGLVVVVTHGSWQRLADLEFVEGDLWIAGAMFLWGLYTIGIRGWNSAMPPLTGLAAMAGVSVLGLAPMAAVELEFGGRLVPSAEAVLGILYVGVIGTAGAYVSVEFRHPQGRRRRRQPFPLPDSGVRRRLRRNHPVRGDRPLPSGRHGADRRRHPDRQPARQRRRGRRAPCGREPLASRLRPVP